MANKTFTTTAGEAIEVFPVSLQQLEMVRAVATEEANREFGGQPQPPTYEVPVMGGEKEIHSHDETTLETEEDRLVFADYQAKLKQFNAIISRRVMNFVLLTGTKIQPPDDDGWIEMQQYFGLNVPEGRLDRRAHYIQTEVIKTLDDIQGLSTAIMEVSGIDTKLVEASAATFSDTVES